MNDVRDIVATLPGLKSVAGVWETLDRRLADGDADFVADLGIAVWERYGSDATPPWQYDGVFDRAIRLLTMTPGALGPALRLLSVTGNQRRSRYAASLLASAQPAADLESVFGGDASEELRACLLHELALRGSEVRHRWATSPHWRHHPLAWLPRSLTPLEGEPSLPHYTIGGRSAYLPVLAPEPVIGHGPVPAARETTTDGESAAIGAAVANWVDESNGRVEARTFALDAALAPEAVGDTLRGLGLESARGLRDGPGRCPASAAWRQLFAAASGGGAYNRGGYGAYGRLLAWRSVAALAAAPEGASAAEVEALAAACSWYSFAGASDWFDDIAWDIGLVTVSPDGRRLAVLAATDTD